MRAANKKWALRAGCYFLCFLQAIHASGATKISASRWKQLTEDKDFSYRKDIESLAPERDNAASNFIQKLIYKLFSLFEGGKANILVWLIVIGVIGYVLYKLFVGRNSFVSRRRRRGEMGEAPGGANEEHIESHNWEALMGQASQNNDWRLAVRYSYMWLLQMLQEKSLIQYTADKTNYEYYRELADTTYKQPFRTISRQYEYTWYGKSELSQAAFADYMNQFNNLKRQLGS